MTDGQELNKFKLENASLKKRCDEAEGELAIIKGIGNKSPEMSALQKANQLLKKDSYELSKMNDIIREEAQVQILATEKVQKDLRELLRETVKELSNAKDLNKSHQKLNGQLQVKLSKYEDKAAHYRRKGVL